MPLIKFNDAGKYMDVLGQPNIEVKAGEVKEVCTRLATSVIKAKKGSLVIEKLAPTEAKAKVKAKAK